MKRTERGWAGHFCMADKCLFRRNTLLEHENKFVVISTVGCCMLDKEVVEIALGTYYETKAFLSDSSDTQYHDIDVSKELLLSSSCYIKEMNENSDLLANEMHEQVVKEVAQRLEENNIKIAGSEG